MTRNPVPAREHRVGTVSDVRTGDLLPRETADALDAFVMPAVDRIDEADLIAVAAVVIAPDYAEITLADGRSFIVPTHWRFASVRVSS